MHEILTGTSLYLLIVGVLIGYYAGIVKLVSPLDKMFMDLFMGVLAFFLLEMGLLAASRLKAVIDKGIFIVAFGILFPLTAALFGAYLGWIFGLSEGGTMRCCCEWVRVCAQYPFSELGYKEWIE